MDNTAKLVRDRRSVRTCDEIPLSRSDLERLFLLMEWIENPYEIPVEVQLLDEKSRSADLNEKFARAALPEKTRGGN